MDILLRPFKDTDADEFALAINESLDSLLPWMAWVHQDYTQEDALGWFHLARLLRQQGTANECGIFSRSGQLLGGAGLRYSEAAEGYCELGYWVRSSQQRQGIASRAVTILAEEAFARPDIDRIELLIAETNIASRAVAIRAGAELIAMRFGLVVLTSGPVNTAIYHLKRPHQSA